MDAYRTLLTRLIDNPDTVERGAEGIRRSVFGYQLRLDLADGFPLLGIDEAAFEKLVHITLWQLSGNTNVKYLKQFGIDDYDEFVDPDTARYIGLTLREGQVGPIEQKQWRSWPLPVELYEVGIILRGKDHQSNVFKLGELYGERMKGGIDQIERAITALKADPVNASPLISGWNVHVLDRTVRVPPVPFFQLHSQPLDYLEMMEYTLEHECEEECDISSVESLREWCVSKDLPTRKLSCQLYQHSADVINDVPSIIVNYALILSLISHVVQMAPGEVVWTGGHVFLKDEDTEAAEQHLDFTYDSRVNVLRLNDAVKDLGSFKETDIHLGIYNVERC